MKFFCKTHMTGSGKMLAICDADILGRKFEEGEIQIEVSEDFYMEKSCSGKEAVRMAKSSAIVNAVGKNIVRLMVENGLVDPERILVIEGVPHAQVVSPD